MTPETIVSVNFLMSPDKGGVPPQSRVVDPCTSSMPTWTRLVPSPDTSSSPLP